ncbi:unnamed protein product, partial [Amoebophrya sp. A25]
RRPAGKGKTLLTSGGLAGVDDMGVGGHVVEPDPKDLKMMTRRGGGAGLASSSNKTTSGPSTSQPRRARAVHDYDSAPQAIPRIGAIGDTSPPARWFSGKLGQKMQGVSPQKKSPREWPVEDEEYDAGIADGGAEKSPRGGRRTAATVLTTGGTTTTTTGGTLTAGGTASPTGGATSGASGMKVGITAAVAANRLVTGGGTKMMHNKAGSVLGDPSSVGGSRMFNSVGLSSSPGDPSSPGSSPGGDSAVARAELSGCGKTNPLDDDEDDEV